MLAVLIGYPPHSTLERKRSSICLIHSVAAEILIERDKSRTEIFRIFSRIPEFFVNKNQEKCYKNSEDSWNQGIKEKCVEKMAELRRRKDGDVLEDPSSQSDRKSGAESSDHVCIVRFPSFQLFAFSKFSWEWAFCYKRMFLLNLNDVNKHLTCCLFLSIFHWQNLIRIDLVASKTT